eukprot:SAG22_NODE_213_length_15041_cov_3.683732_4_plen_177_part_00
MPGRTSAAALVALLANLAFVHGQAEGSSDVACVTWVVSSRHMGTMWKPLETAGGQRLCRYRQEGEQQMSHSDTCTEAGGLKIAIGHVPEGGDGCDVPGMEAPPGGGGIMLAMIDPSCTVGWSAVSPTVIGAALPFRVTDDGKKLALCKSTASGELGVMPVLGKGRGVCTVRQRSCF